MQETLEKRFLEDIVSCRGILLKICRTYCWEPEDRDDLYQEIISNAWKSYPRFEGRSKFSTWLYRVALNTALSESRKNRFQRSTTDLNAVENQPEVNNDQEQIQLLYRAIGQLDPQEKSLTILYLDDLSYREIAEVTGLTENHVGVRLHRVKDKIKSMLSRYEKE
jgi:RNA polymerase sigma-70 factor (ECF subfamily)